MATDTTPSGSNAWRGVAERYPPSQTIEKCIDVDSGIAQLMDTSRANANYLSDIQGMSFDQIPLHQQEAFAVGGDSVLPLPTVDFAMSTTLINRGRRIQISSRVMERLNAAALEVFASLPEWNGDRAWTDEELERMIIYNAL